MFEAAGCDATLNGLYLAGDRQHMDHHTRVDHATPHGTSHEYYRGMLDGASRAVFNGKIIVRPGRAEDRCEADQQQPAAVATMPRSTPSRSCEIFADDVRCTHGATVGQFDEAQLFYLHSRGIEEAIAQAC